MIDIHICELKGCAMLDGVLFSRLRINPGYRLERPRWLPARFARLPALPCPAMWLPRGEMRK
jgi:hypothetical protein